ncbi:hypothetical protein [Rahnella contaminans]|uniref:hypothetical protein n=1 Tax=Rahnella contaminans TaxID=2703882 RepID=UPI0023D9A7A4|nr:hypothetical protein [Rahnella contaminans]MDF1897168.1 hypothetical protein [Rahnella contaminans]
MTHSQSGFKKSAAIKFLYPLVIFIESHFTLISLVLTSIISTGTQANIKINNEVWAYQKLSDVDIFGKHDSNLNRHLNEMYSQVVKDFGEKN